MDIYIQNREGFTGGEIGWEDVVAPESHTHKRVQVGDGYWALEACTPWKAFGLFGIPDDGDIESPFAVIITLATAMSPNSRLRRL